MDAVALHVGAGLFPHGERFGIVAAAEFIGVGLANLLVKGPFKGDQMVPQTGVIPADAGIQSA